MKAIVGIFLLVLLFGCAGSKEITKPDTSVKPSVAVKSATTVHPGKQLPATAPKPVILTLKVNHFVTFKSDPLGAEVIVIDTKSGKEVQSFGRTPVRILLMNKIAQFDSTNKKILGVGDVNANTVGIEYGQFGTDGAEFQFKFRLDGYYDNLAIERVPLISLDSEKVIGVSMTPKGSK